jgi:hypothetical protein
MKGILQHPGAPGNADSPKKTAAPRPEPTRRERHAAANNKALWRYSNALAALLGWRPKTVQDWTKVVPEDLPPSPSERLEHMVLALRQLGAHEADAMAPIAAVLAALGYPMPSRWPQALASGDSATALAEFLGDAGAFGQAFAAALADRRLDQHERESLRAKAREVQEAIQLAMAAIDQE